MLTVNQKETGNYMKNCCKGKQRNLKNKNQQGLIEMEI